MIIYAHRGNLYGPDQRENSVAAIEMAIAKGFHVEVDIRSDDSGVIWLGHDKPQYTIPNKLWVDEEISKKIIWHAKDFNAMNWALNKQLHCFGHSKDRFVMTSRGYIWTCDRDLTGTYSIIMSREVPVLEGQTAGLCTDNPCRAKDFLDYKY